ncbi:MAG: Fur-regulated basic protein FbpA [Sporolactobacillus sp.]
MADPVLLISNEQRKESIIEGLLDHGIYKTENHQLYELSLSELEYIYQKILQLKSS